MGGADTGISKGGGWGLRPARYEMQGWSADRIRPDTKSGGGGGGGAVRLSPIQKVGRGGLLSRKGGGTLNERGGCNPQTPLHPPLSGYK